jgi:hypothetical protein
MTRSSRTTALTIAGVFTSIILLVLLISRPSADNSPSLECLLEVDHPPLGSIAALFRFTNAEPHTIEYEVVQCPSRIRSWTGILLSGEAIDIPLSREKGLYWLEVSYRRERSTSVSVLRDSLLGLRTAFARPGPGFGYEHTLISERLPRGPHAEPVAPREPPPCASVSDAPDDRTLDSLPAPGSSGGR